MTGLKEQLKEIVDLVELVPDQFKAQCFDLLLKEAIATTRAPVQKPAVPPPVKDEPGGKSTVGIPGGADDDADGDKSGQEEISGTDLHVKTKKFMEKNGITIPRLNELFYKEGDAIKSLVEDYGSNKMAEIQMRIALFQAFLNGLGSGEFATTVDAVRAECVARKSFDGPNWASVFKRKAGLFDFGTFSRDVAELRLSEEGKQELGNILKLLA